MERDAQTPQGEQVRRNLVPDTLTQRQVAERMQMSQRSFALREDIALVRFWIALSTRPAFEGFAEMLDEVLTLEDGLPADPGVDTFFLLLWLQDRQIGAGSDAVEHQKRDLTNLPNTNTDRAASQ